ncbi:MAG: fumarylacetoacetase [Cyclobacteriaceae bacterium]
MNKANNPQLTSWVEVPQNSDFPIQNLPFGVFSTRGTSPRAGVAIGDHILDIHFLSEKGYLASLGLSANLFNQPTLNDFIGLGRKEAGKVRERLSELLRSDNAELRDTDGMNALVSQSEATMHLPVEVGDYTDFYSSIEHATNIGSMIRDPKNALMPNWKHLPVGYHGRASSIVVSETPVRRPKGQAKNPDEEVPHFGPSSRLDFELEMAFVTCSKTELGSSVSVAEAEDHIFGFVLFNDWSARDLQTWEYVPLGPFLAKNFASSVSPWIVTLDALEPFRCNGPEQDVKVLPYLEYSGARNYDINLQVGITPDGGTEDVVCDSNFKYMYWNIAQQLAHQTVNGCNINVGDMYASGTISGPTPDSYGSMFEIAWKGTKPFKMSDGTERKWILDGDTVAMRGWAEKDGVRIGFGEVSGKVLPAN